MSIIRAYQQHWKQWARWCAKQGVPNNAISAPKLPDFLAPLFRVGLVWCTIGVHHSAVSAILEPHHLHKALNYPIIPKLPPSTFKLTQKTATL